MKVELYHSEYKVAWNEFIDIAKNATFLFKRDFLEYHKQRFQDYSLIIREEDGNIAGLLPANITDTNEVISHQGLTYGGFILKKDIKLTAALSVIYHTLKFLFDNKVNVFNLKCFPQFYNCSVSDDIDYALFLLNADLYRKDMAFVVDMQKRIPYTGNVRREGNKAEKAGAVIKESHNIDNFWNQVLVPNLMERFGVEPVHTVAEISMLKKLFPDNIKQYDVYLNSQIVAGTTIFIANKVAHCQYISATEQGRKSGCLNHLFKFLIDTEFALFRYFDFGIVNENSGRSVNSGMLFWKESFGGRAQRHDFYRIHTSNYKNLEYFI